MPCTCQSPSYYFGGLCGQLRWQKKMIVVSSNVQECDTAVGVACSTRQVTVPQRWGFFSCPSFLSLGHWFSCQALKNLVVLHFVFVLGLVLILLISIWFDFNVSWSLLFFSISSLSAFNLIFFVYNLVLILLIPIFSSFAFILLFWFCTLEF
jgi:hypothetical protein